jgi:hypothetical protein
MISPIHGFNQYLRACKGDVVYVTILNGFCRKGAGLEKFNLWNGRVTF